jgi:hypothetical protein
VTAVKIRLEPHDDYLHTPDEASNFNESMYFNVFDPSRQLGGFFRVGNRVNEGMAEVTVCLYLPDGRVAFTFGRPAIDNNERFDAGGLRFEVVEPFEDLRVTYDGKLTMLTDPLQMADPRKAFTENPRVACSASLRYTKAAPPYGGEPDEPTEKPEEQFAKAHYEQLVRAEGTITVGDEQWSVEGFGLRDHSWGPRYWQAPWYYRWLTANAGADFGFMASRIAKRDGPGTRGGFVWDGGQLHLCGDCEITTTWTEGPDRYHEIVEVRLASREREWRARGRVLNLIPLRNRREGLVTRISEGMTEWTMADGRVGYGLSEYLDQIVDGVPVGFSSAAR